jgi:hypothetical protein
LSKKLELHPHPSAPPSAISGIEVDVSRSGNQLDLVYRISGDIDRLLIPVPAKGERTDNLWQTTCPEAFIQPEGAGDYYEYNLSPSTQWAGYSFTAYRTGMTNFETRVPVMTIARHRAPADAGAQAAPSEPLGSCFRRNTERLDLVATVWLPETTATLPWRLGLTTVIEEKDGRKSFWALAHPSPDPNFHHSDSFIHLLPA